MKEYFSFVYYIEAPLEQSLGHITVCMAVIALTFNMKRQRRKTLIYLYFKYYQSILINNDGTLN